MSTQFTSYTILPDEFYIERSADRQIVSIINSMQRPGYVLVPRQMGKTNLLLHTKKKLESERSVFVYLDFSSIRIQDDKAFFELLIDKAIEENPSLFAEAKDVITKSRSERKVSSANRYTVEILELLSHVDKLVFVLDEIDALARNTYSNSIFSQIRSDYFQRVNYKELEKLTYLLSGVIEPKDLIKDPNISPFNIGEKIYLRTFTRVQSLELIQRAGLQIQEEVFDRVYYWTNGHPRMLNDICNALQYLENPDVDDVDNTIRDLYLESFDRAPVDHIRDLINKDGFLRNAYIQLFYEAELSVELKQKLYLAGIADYQGVNFCIKNQVIRAALPIDWVQSINSQIRDFLPTIEGLIYLNKSYNEAIKQLQRFIELECETIEEFNKAYFLLGLCYFRTYKTEESQRCLNLINFKDTTDGDTLLKASLIKGYNYSNIREYTQSIACYESIIKAKKRDWELYAKACIARIDALIQSGGDNLSEARKSLYKFLEDPELQYNYSFIAISYYELSALEDACGNESKALECIEEAIRYAGNNEMPTLLYYKLLLSTNIEQQNDTIDALLSYLSAYDKKPEIEDFDKVLNLNYSVLACILSEIILNHSSYVSEIDEYLKWFNNSKEAAYNSIVKYLRDYDPEKALPFAKHILDLNNTKKWHFGSDHIFNALLIQYKYESNLKNALDLYQYIEANKYVDNRREVVEVLLRVVREFLLIGRFDKARDVTDFFFSTFKETDDDYVSYVSILMSYYIALLDIRKNDITAAQRSSAIFISKASEGLHYDYHNCNPDYINLFQKLINEVREALSSLPNNIPAFVNKNEFGKIGRNEMVEVIYSNTGNKVSAKYKKIEADISAGLCRIIKVEK